MENEYVKLWTSYSAYFEPLGDAEVGRLARAMIAYKSNGVEPKFSGNERFVWPAIKRDMDEAEKARLSYIQKQAEYGKKGGRPKKPDPFEEKGSLFEERVESQGLRTKDNGLRTEISSSGDTRAMYDKSLADLMTYYEDNMGSAAPRSVGQAICQWRERMPDDLIRAAIDTAAKAGKNWNYAEGCLKRWERDGIRTLAALRAAEAARRQPQPRRKTAQDEFLAIARGEIP